MGAINFYLKKPEPVSGKSLIFLQWKYRGMRLVFSTGESINPQDWNSDKQEVKKNKKTEDGDYLLNDLLRNLKLELERVYKTEIKNGIPTPTILRTHLKAYLDKHKNAEKVAKEKPTLWNLIDRFISGEIRDKKQRKKTAGTLKQYSTVKKHLEGFSKKLSFEKINKDFLDNYLTYLEKVAKLAPNTIAKNLQTLKVFMNEGLERGYHSNTYFKKISMSWEESENVALSRKEINKLYKHNFKDNQRLERVRDLFVFGCNVGLRISDLQNIKPHNIIDVNGEKRIRIKTQKTGETVEIPCHEQCLEIFDKYDQQLPKITDQKFNEYIKEACEEAGLTATGRLQKEPNKPLNELIASHTMRRTFCTNLYNEGVPPVVIMKVSGHKTETAFLKYIKVSQTDAADKLSAHYAKIKKSNLIAV
jgi:integrase